MTKEEFQKYYKPELNQFKNDVIKDKNDIKDQIRASIKKSGYNDLISIRENTLDEEKKN